MRLEEAWYLSVFVEDTAEEPEGVGEALGTSTLSYAHHTMLLGMEDTPLGGRRHGDQDNT